MVQRSGRYSSAVRAAGVISFGVLSFVAANGRLSGQSSRSRFPIRESAIKTAMQQKQIPVGGVEIKIAAPITSSALEPQLSIRSITPGDKHNAQMLIECKNAAECLPFYASASWPANVDLASLRESLTHEASAQKSTASRLASADPASLRAGSPATLLLDGERVHVMLRVVCLEGGDAGAKVRVTTPDRRQQYVADVIAPGILKGIF